MLGTICSRVLLPMVADLALGVVGMVHVPEQGVIEFLEGSALLGGLHIGETCLRV